MRRPNAQTLNKAESYSSAPANHQVAKRGNQSKEFTNWLLENQ